MKILLVAVLAILTILLPLLVAYKNDKILDQKRFLSAAYLVFSSWIVLVVSDLYASFFLTRSIFKTVQAMQKLSIVSCSIVEVLMALSCLLLIKSFMFKRDVIPATTTYIEKKPSKRNPKNKKGSLAEMKRTRNPVDRVT